MNQINNVYSFNCECLLIHAGVPSIARGFYAIYYHLKKNNINVELIIINNDEFSTQLKILKKFENLKIVGFSMHWHPQIAISLKLAELIKTFPHNQNVKIVFGGISAGYFAEELLDYSFIDYVIKGDGIKPIYLLAQQIISKKNNLSTIPNLYFIDNNTKVCNKETYSANAEILTTYEIDAINNKDLFLKSRNVIGIYNGGCIKNCIYCGGGESAYKKWGNTEKIKIRNSESIIKTIEALSRSRIKQLYIVIDPDGKGQYISNYLSKVDLSFLKILTLSFWGLPTFENFQRCLSSTKTPNNIKIQIEISPESGDYNIRKKIKDYNFTNRQLEEILDKIFVYYKKVEILLYYSYFLPYTDKENTETRNYINELTIKYNSQLQNKKLQILFFPLSTDPGSKIQTNECDSLNLVTHSFNDYYSKMLAFQTNTGNFLEHFNKEMDQDEAYYYQFLFRFESYLRTYCDDLYLCILHAFDSFYDYQVYFNNIFKDFYKYFINIYKSPKSMLILNDTRVSLLGFDFYTDGANPKGFIVIYFLNFLKTQILEHFHSIYFNKSETIELYKILNELFIKYSIIISLRETIKLNIRPNHVETLNFNFEKVEYVVNFSDQLFPVRNNICEIYEFSYSYNKRSPYSHIHNLLFLGKKYFVSLINKIKGNNLLFIYLESVKEFLNITDVNNLKNTSEDIWNTILKYKNNTYAEVISNLLIIEYVPVDAILTELKIPHNHFMIQKDYTFDVSQPEKFNINCFYGVFTKSCDIRLINFYINYLKYCYSLTSTITPLNNPKNILFSIYFELNESFENKNISIMEELNPIEKSILELSDGTMSLNFISEKLRNKNLQFSQEAFTDAVKHLYNMQFIY